MSLSIQTGAQGERTSVLALRGEVDYATAQQFREAVSELLGTGRAGLLIVDLAEVSFKYAEERLRGIHAAIRAWQSVGTSVRQAYATSHIG